MCRCFEGDADGVYARFLYAWPKEPPFAKPANSVEEIEPEVINALTRLVRLPDHAGEAFVPARCRAGAGSLGGLRGLCGLCAPREG